MLKKECTNSDSKFTNTKAYSFHDDQSSCFYLLILIFDEIIFLRITTDYSTSEVSFFYDKESKSILNYVSLSIIIAKSQMKHRIFMEKILPGKTENSLWKIEEIILFKSFFLSRYLNRSLKYKDSK